MKGGMSDWWICPQVLSAEIPGLVSKERMQSWHTIMCSVGLRAEVPAW